MIKRIQLAWHRWRYRQNQDKKALMCFLNHMSHKELVTQYTEYQILHTAQRYHRLQVQYLISQM